MSTERWSRADVARTIDATLLRPEATAADVQELCREAGNLGTYAVCVSPSLVAVARNELPAGFALAAVCGFPSGAHRSDVKAAEAAAALADGATEIDMVANLGSARSGDWEAVQADIAAVRTAADPAVLKVILETALLGEAEIVAACRAAEAAGADFVKTSTGFCPAGGASAEAVRLLAVTVGGRLGVKASGGIRTARDARAMLDAGATRLGCSASRPILDAWPPAAAAPEGPDRPSGQSIEREGKS